MSNTGIDMEEVKKWIKENYPHVYGNEKLMLALYKKKVKNESIKELFSRSAVKYPFREVKDLAMDVGAVIVFTKTEIMSEKVVEVCAVCYRKDCNNPEHHGKKNLYILRMYGGDATGDITVTLLTIDEKELFEVREKDTFIIIGKVKEWKGIKEVTAGERDVISVGQDEIMDIDIFIDFYELNASAGGVEKEKFERLLQEHPLARKLVDRIYIREENGKVYFE